MSDPSVGPPPTSSRQRIRRRRAHGQPGAAGRPVAQPPSYILLFGEGLVPLIIVLIVGFALILLAQLGVLSTFGIAPFTERAIAHHPVLVILVAALIGVLGTLAVQARDLLRGRTFIMKQDSTPPAPQQPDPNIKRKHGGPEGGSPPPTQPMGLPPDILEKVREQAEPAFNAVAQKLQETLGPGVIVQPQVFVVTQEQTSAVEAQTAKGPPDGSVTATPPMPQQHEATASPGVSPPIRASQSVQPLQPNASPKPIPQVPPPITAITPGQAEVPPIPKEQPTTSPPPVQQVVLSPTTVLHAKLTGSEANQQTEMGITNAPGALGTSPDAARAAAPMPPPTAAGAPGVAVPNAPAPNIPDFQPPVVSPKPIAKIEPVDPATLEAKNPPNYAAEQHEHPHSRLDYQPKSGLSVIPGSAETRMRTSKIEQMSTARMGDGQYRSTHLSIYAEGWKIIGASVRGLGHAISPEGRFREDDFEFTVVDERVAYVAIADGVGSKTFSRWGARAAVLGAVKHFDSPARYQDITTLISAVERNPGSGMAHGISRDILFECFKAAEGKVYQRAQSEGKSPDELYSTLLTFLAVPYLIGSDSHLFVASLQIGDGALLGGTIGTLESWYYLQRPQFQGVDNQVMPFLKSSESDWRASFSVEPSLRGQAVLGMTDGTDNDIVVRMEGTKPIPEVEPFIQECGIAAAFTASSPAESARTLEQALSYRKRGSFDDRTIVAIYHGPVGNRGDTQ